MNADPPAHEPVTLYLAAAVCDPAGVLYRPGAVASTGGGVGAWGPADELEREFAGATALRCPDDLILPGFINAHAHLELSAIGPQPYGGDFTGWVRMLREHWPGDGDPWSKAPDEHWFAAAAKQAAMDSHKAGVEHVVDISRFDAVRLARSTVAGLPGTTLVELFGIGAPFDADALARINEPAQGFQPHAPYSAGPSIFAAAARSGRPVSTHLAETRDELRFIAAGDGPFLDLLQAVGKWDASFAAHYGHGQTPVRWMEPYLREALNFRGRGWLVAHCNYVTDDDVALLAETKTSVAYCPVASAYFGHTGHRYREMIAAGVNVCLGTDSIVCQSPDETQPLSLLPQMRFLYERDRTDPATLVRMACTNARHWLASDDDHAPAVTSLVHIRIDPADPADALVQALTNRQPGRSNFFWRTA